MGTCFGIHASYTSRGASLALSLAFDGANSLLSYELAVLLKLLVVGGSAIGVFEAWMPRQAYTDVSTATSIAEPPATSGQIYCPCNSGIEPNSS